MTRFYIVRHGETQTNRENVFAGHFNAMLTDLGREQARLLSKALSDVEFDVAYSSDLDRAYETACIALNKRLPIQKDERLREIFVGDWEHVSADELDKIYPEERELWQTAFGKCTPTNGERVADAYTRIVATITDFAVKNEGKTVFVASHGGVIHLLINWAKGVVAEDVTKDGLPGNTAIAILDVDNGKPTLIKHNDTSHLGNLATFPAKNI